MDPTYISGLSALAGSAIGAASSFATTWLTQQAKYRSDRTDKEIARREDLYGAFIDEASNVFADAIVHEIQDTGQLVKVYSLVSRMRLVASSDIIREAEAVMARLVATYNAPNKQVSELREATLETMDLLQQFGETCRKELSAM